MLVSHASFGMDIAAATFGAEAILTTDYVLKDHFEQCFPRIHERFHRMTRQLTPLYRSALLPVILGPEDLLPFL